MIDFIIVIFKSVLKVVIAIAMIAVVLFGVYMMEKVGTGYAFLIIIGGLLLVVLSTGIIATIIHIDENLESIENNLSKMNINLNKNTIGSIIQKTCKRCKKSVDASYTSCPHSGSNSFE